MHNSLDCSPHSCKSYLLQRSSTQVYSAACFPSSDSDSLACAGRAVTDFA